MMLETFSIEVDPQEARRLRELLDKRRLDGVTYNSKKRWFSFWHRFTITAPPWVVAQLNGQVQQMLQEARSSGNLLSMREIQIVVIFDDAPPIRGMLHGLRSHGVASRESRRWLAWRRFDVTGPEEGIQLFMAAYNQWREGQSMDRTW